MSSEQTSIIKKSASINQDYKGHLNQLDGFVNRLEKVRHNLYPTDKSEKITGVGELKKPSPDITFLEIWQDHTQYFCLLLNRLEKVVQELEEF